MKALIQRCQWAKVEVSGAIIGQIEQGIMALVAVEPSDSQIQAHKLAEKLLHYRIFADADDKMNLSVKAIEGGILLVPQFTLAADTSRGLRPSFSSAASPAMAKQLFDEFADYLKKQYQHIETGEFGADMQVSLCNDGPVTFMLQVE
jgi:D-aminoacyl-tRNA deacylase